MIDFLERKEFSQRETTLLTHLRDFSRAVSEESPTQYARDYYKQFAADLQDLTERYELILRTKDYSDIENLFYEIKSQIHGIGSSSSRGELECGREDLLSEIYKEMHLYQEKRYSKYWNFA